MLDIKVICFVFFLIWEVLLGLGSCYGCFVCFGYHSKGCLFETPSFSLLAHFQNILDEPKIVLDLKKGQGISLKSNVVLENMECRNYTTGFLQTKGKSAKMLHKNGIQSNSFDVSCKTAIFIRFVRLEKILQEEWCFDSYKIPKNWLRFEFCPASWPLWPS